MGEDAKMLIKEWLKIRPDNADTDALFVTYNRMKRKYVPLTGRLLSNMLTKIAKRLKLVEPNGLNRYHIHLHEFRDLFKSLCTLHGVNVIASEFFLGHTIDKLGYDKSPQYDVEFFKNEYLKVEPALNILSNTNGQTVEKVREEMKKEMAEIVEQLVLENKKLKERLTRIEKAFTAFAKIAMEDPDSLPMLKMFLEPKKE